MPQNNSDGGSRKLHLGIVTEIEREIVLRGSLESVPAERPLFL